jgi:hypothetical protein
MFGSLAVAVKLIDLQLIYGVAGAREKFEDLASQLVKGEQPDADKVRIVQGDGGIDVYVGDMDDPEGVHVYQCKFFPLSVGESQKDQIRKSFKTAANSPRYKLGRWTLCLPIDLSFEEKTWFDDWRKKQTDCVIEDPWGALKLEGLLYLEKNQGLKAEFFKQHHLTQIGELHGLLFRLLPDIAARLSDSALATSKQREEAAQDRKEEYLAEFSKDLLAEYKAACSPTPLKLSELQKAARAGDEKRHKELTAASHRPEFWKVTICPERLPDRPLFETLKACRGVVEQCQVRSDGRAFPYVMHAGHEAGVDWVGFSSGRGRGAECWRMSQRGVFMCLRSILDDALPEDHHNPNWNRMYPPRFTPERFLDIDDAFRFVAYAYRYAARLAKHGFGDDGGGIQINLGLTGTKQRVLITRNDPARLEALYHSTATELEMTWSHTRERLIQDPDDLAADALLWFFERFNWGSATKESTARLLSHLVPA